MRSSWRNRRVDDHRQLHRQTLGRRQAARLRDHEIGAGHQALDLLREALRKQPARMLRGEFLQRRQHRLVLARQCDQLEVSLHLEQARGQHVEPPRPAPPDIIRNVGRAGSRPNSAAQAARSSGWPNAGMIGIPLTCTVSGAMPRACATRSRRWPRNSRACLARPHAVQVEIGDLHPHRRVDAPLADLARQQLGGQEVRADDRVRALPLDLREQCPAIEPLDRAPDLLRRRGGIDFVGLLVQVAPAPAGC